MCGGTRTYRASPSVASIGADLATAGIGDCAMQLDDIITAEDKKTRLPWSGVLCVIFGAIPLILLFAHFGKSAFALPTLDSAAMVAIVIAMRWQLRRHLWFWMTMTVFAALHLALVLFVPWTDKWNPAIVIIPLGIADLYAMLWILSAVRTRVKATH